jgi:proteasome lid subunit RPN8/RPN11
MLKVRQAEYAAMRRHGEETYPHECCGVMLGRMEAGTNVVEQVVRAGNIRTDSLHNRYQIAPQELVKIQRQARQQRVWTSSASTTRTRTIPRDGRRPDRTTMRRTGWGAAT